MTDLYQRQLKDQTVQEVIRTLERRVNALGVAEPLIAAQGSRGDQILVQLPGVTDVEQAKRVIKTTAQLSLKLVETSAATRETLLSGTGGRVPDNMEVVSGPGTRRASPSTTCCAARRSSPGATSRARASGSTRTTARTSTSR